MTDQNDARRESVSPAPPASAPRRKRRLRLLMWFLLAWAVAAYLIVPQLSELYFSRHKGFTEVDRVTRTSDGHPGDPINIALVGSDAEVVRAMTAAGWFPADPITFATSVRIAVDSVLRRPDDDAPVSNLYLFGRKQDLAFEQEVGESARERNHVRFWRSPLHADGDRPLWVGAASRDRRVELSHRTAQITHQIAPDIDTERDLLIDDLDAAGWLARIFAVTGIGPTLNGRNGGGDRYFTDGELYVGMLASSRGAPRRAERLPDPTPIVIKNTLWSWLAPRPGPGTEVTP